VPIGLVLAAASGIGIAWMDSRPGFDATGITVVLLVGAAGFCAFLVAMPGRARVWLPILVAVLVGGWVPILEMPGASGTASLASLLFSAIGATVGYLAARTAGNFVDHRDGGFTVR